MFSCVFLEPALLYITPFLGGNMSETELMQQEIERLRTQVKALKSRNLLSQNYYYSDAAQKNWLDVHTYSAARHYPRSGADHY